jgi:hypothetical protein
VFEISVIEKLETHPHPTNPLTLKMCYLYEKNCLKRSELSVIYVQNMIFSPEIITAKTRFSDPIFPLLYHKVLFANKSAKIDRNFRRRAPSGPLFSQIF